MWGLSPLHMVILLKEICRKTVPHSWHNSDFDSRIFEFLLVHITRHALLYGKSVD